jgi:hypothetical protein
MTDNAVPDFTCRTPGSGLQRHRCDAHGRPGHPQSGHVGGEAVGFRHWRDGWYGVLITPWFMNLIGLPG